MNLSFSEVGVVRDKVTSLMFCQDVNFQGWKLFWGKRNEMTLFVI